LQAAQLTYGAPEESVKDTVNDAGGPWAIPTKRTHRILQQLCNSLLHNLALSASGTDAGVSVLYYKITQQENCYAE